MELWQALGRGRCVQTRRAMCRAEPQGLEQSREPWGRRAVTGLADRVPLVLRLCFRRDEFNIQVLHAFVELHEFTDLNLVQALR